MVVKFFYRISFIYFLEIKIYLGHYNNIVFALDFTKINRQLLELQHIEFGKDIIGLQSLEV